MDRISKQNQGGKSDPEQDGPNHTDGTFHPTAAECTLFSSTHGILFKKDQMWGNRKVLTNVRLKSHQVSFPNTMEGWCL